MNKQSASGDNLAWQAFRYVAEEMAPAEIVSFEEQLDGDQAAREAVAEVVRLSAALRTVQRFQSASKHSSSETSAQETRPVLSRTAASFAAPARWMALGAAACLTVMFGWRLWTAPTEIVEQRPLSNARLLAAEAQNRQVALAWSETADEPSDESSTEADDEFAAGDEADAVSADQDREEESPDDDWEAPSWLSAGVSPREEAANPAAAEENR